MYVIGAYAANFPMAPIGGMFVAVIGAGVVLGALVPGMRSWLLAAGFAAASLLATLYGARLSAGLPMPTRFQVLSLVAAILVEIILFAVVLRRTRPYGPRATMLASLTIVGGHFFLMYPAFGWVFLLLGAAALINVWIAFVIRSSPARLHWLIDGLLKIAIAGPLLLGSPVLRGWPA